MDLFLVVALFVSPERKLTPSLDVTPCKPAEKSSRQHGLGEDELQGLPGLELDARCGLRKGMFFYV